MYCLQIFVFTFYLQFVSVTGLAALWFEMGYLAAITGH